MNGTELPLLSSDFQVKETLVNVPFGQVVPLVGQDPTRWALLLAAQNNAVIQFTTNGNAPTTQGVTVPSQGGTLVLSFREVGALTTFAWFAVGTGSGGNVTAIEILYRPQG